MNQSLATPTGRDRPQIVFLFSDTGGGHRSAAQAICEALEQEYPGQTKQVMVDIFREYAPPLINRVPDFYPPLSRKPWLLGLIFHLSDGALRTRLFLHLLWPFLSQPCRRLLRDHPADLYVAVHPLINPPLGRAMEGIGLQTPYLTVVTDLVTTHATWFWKRADLVVVPTEAARQRGLRCGIPGGRLRVIGLPVSTRFGQAAGKAEARVRLGWAQDRPVALLVGGGEGMGPLEQMARAIDAACLPLDLAIVCGRNQALKARLEQFPWHAPVNIYGFVQDMPAFLSAADILVTKAGPGTISEALAAGLPMILTSRLNGPEEGNVGYVTGPGAAIWASRPEQVVEALRRWLEQPETRLEAARACRALARPRAAADIAAVILEQVKRQ
jgi:1,2-diacylglycerol 3-beta-galactosyltransferase